MQFCLLNDVPYCNDRKHAKVNFYDFSASYNKNKKSDALRFNPRSRHDRQKESRIRELKKENQVDVNA